MVLRRPAINTCRLAPGPAAITRTRSVMTLATATLSLSVAISPEWTAVGAGNDADAPRPRRFRVAQTPAADGVKPTRIVCDRRGKLVVKDLLLWEAGPT